MTLHAREELIATARRMSELGLAPGTSGNVSVRTAQGFLVTPSGMSYDGLRGDDAVEVKADGTLRPGQRAPSTEWQLHRDILARRPDTHAIVHTHSMFCTTLSMLRRPIPAVHYTVVLAGTDEIPCADYATFGSPELAQSVVRALGAGLACLMANHGMVALGPTLPAALRLAAEVETLAAQYWHALQLGSPHILDRDELLRVRHRFASSWGQKKPGR
ncbi:MAG: class II aldolase/adducin family protein [Deltaproteobacteria bacterium]|nr:class II aldolase/adducin family protein [Deltaproteobacteria bacterium]